MTRASIFIAGLAVAALGVPAQAQQDFGSPELIAAAKKEGRLVLYTANFAAAISSGEPNSCCAAAGRASAATARPAMKNDARFMRDPPSLRTS